VAEALTWWWLLDIAVRNDEARRAPDLSIEPVQGGGAATSPETMTRKPATDDFSNRRST
jgi:hypothetical protein